MVGICNLMSGTMMYNCGDLWHSQVNLPFDIQLFVGDFVTVMKDQYFEDSKVQMSPLRRTTHVKVITYGWFNLAIKLVFVQSFIHTMSLICLVSIYSFALFVPLFTLHLNPFSNLKLYKIYIKDIHSKQFSWRAKQFISIHLLALKLCVFKAGTDICMRGWVSGWMPRQPEPSPCQPTSSTSASRWLLSSLIDQDFRIVQPAVDFLI